MIYKRQVDNPEIIQYIILFVLTRAERPVTHDQLTEIILENVNINFGDFRIALDNLETIGMVRVFVPDKKTTYCEILPKGIESNGFFYKEIPIYIREPLEEYMEGFFRREEERQSVRGELMPINTREFMAEMSIYEGKTPLMKLDLYAGTREYALQMIKRFKENPENIYKAIMNMIANFEIEKDGGEE